MPDTIPLLADLHTQLRRIDDLKRANLLAELDHQVTAAEARLRADELGQDEFAVLSLIARHYPINPDNGGPVPW